MKQKLLTLMLLTLLPLAASAEVWIVNNIYYEVWHSYSSNRTSAKVIKSPSNYSGDLSIPSIIQNPDENEERPSYWSAHVSCIDREAFADCSGLTSITIDCSFFTSDYTSLEYFPAGMLKGCDNLTQITLKNNTTGCYSPEGSAAIIEGYTLKAGCKNTNIPSDVKYIGVEAFAGSKRLTEITIPSNVVAIEDRAFVDCPNLENVNIYGGKYLLSISPTAFEGCTSLTTVTVKSGGLEKRDQNSDEKVSPFAKCPNFTNAIFEEGAEKIGDYAFTGCTGLTSIIIPNSMKEIGKLAFAGCTGLTSVSIGGDGIKIGAAAFGRCTSLTDVIIEEGEKLVPSSYGSAYTSIDEYTYTEGIFDGCSNLRSIFLRGIITPNSSTSFLSRIFYGTPSMLNIYYSDFNVLWNSSIMNGSVYGRYRIFLSGEEVNRLNNSEDFADKEHSYFVYRIEEEGDNKGKFVSYGLKDNYTTIPINVDASLVSDGILNINAFKAWRQEYQNAKFILENGKYKCGWAVEVEHLKIPEGVTTIPDGAFQGCASLKSVTLPSSLTSIGETAFFNCENLLLVFSPIEKPFTFNTEMRTSIFTYSSETDPGDLGYSVWQISGENGVTIYFGIKKDQLTLYVPKGSVSDYKNTNDWNKFPNIVGYDPDNPPADPDKLYPVSGHNIVEDLIGDANNDGKVNVADIVAIVNHLNGETPANFNLKQADADNNNEVNMADVEAVARIIMK